MLLLLLLLHAAAAADDDDGDDDVALSTGSTDAEFEASFQSDIWVPAFVWYLDLLDRWC